MTWPDDLPAPIVSWDEFWQYCEIVDSDTWIILQCAMEGDLVGAAGTFADREWYHVRCMAWLGVQVQQLTPPTDAEIFDACYRELVRRWGPAGET